MMEWWIWLLIVLCALLIIFMFVFFIYYYRVFIPKQNAKKNRKLQVQIDQMEEVWRKELEEKGLSPVEIEQIIEQRKQTMLLKQQANAQTATTFILGGWPLFNALNNDKKD